MIPSIAMVKYCVCPINLVLLELSSFISSLPLFTDSGRSSLIKINLRRGLLAVELSHRT